MICSSANRLFFIVHPHQVMDSIHFGGNAGGSGYEIKHSQKIVGVPFRQPRSAAVATMVCPCSWGAMRWMRTTETRRRLLWPTERNCAKRPTPHERTAALNEAGAGIEAIAHVTTATNPPNRHDGHQQMELRDKGGIGTLDDDAVVTFEPGGFRQIAEMRLRRYLEQQWHWADGLSGPAHESQAFAHRPAQRATLAAQTETCVIRQWRQGLETDGHTVHCLDGRGSVVRTDHDAEPGRAGTAGRDKGLCKRRPPDGATHADGSDLGEPEAETSKSATDAPKGIESRRHPDGGGEPHAEDAGSRDIARCNWHAAGQIAGDERKTMDTYPQSSSKPCAPATIRNRSGIDSMVLTLADRNVTREHFTLSSWEAGTKPSTFF